MRYFHRTSLPPDEVVTEAERYFAARLAPVESGGRTRRYAGAIGQVTVAVRPEGGHYTLVTVVTDQVGESELDKLAKRFLTLVHKRAEPQHVVRGAY